MNLSEGSNTTFPGIELSQVVEKKYERKLDEDQKISLFLETDKIKVALQMLDSRSKQVHMRQLNKN